MDQMSLAEFVTKTRAAADDMADAFESDETRTLEEWLEELATTIHHSDD